MNVKSARKYAPTVIGWLMFFSGVLSVISVFRVVTSTFLTRGLTDYIPIATTSRTATLIIGLLLMSTARGLWRKNRDAWNVALILTILSIFLHLLKGFNFEEIIFSVFILLVLIWQQSSFQIASRVKLNLEYFKDFLSSMILFFIYYLVGSSFLKSGMAHSIFYQSVAFFPIVISLIFILRLFENYMTEVEVKGTVASPQKPFFENNFATSRFNQLRSRRILSKGKGLLIEVILPVYNGEKFLKKLLPSLKKQRYDGPVIISAANNHSTDNSVQLLKKYGIPVTDAFAYQRIGYAQVKAIKQAEKFFTLLKSNQRIFLFLDQDTYLIRNDYFANLAKTFADESKMVSMVSPKKGLFPLIAVDSLSSFFFYLMGFGPKELINRIGKPNFIFHTWNLAIRGTLVKSLNLTAYLEKVMVDDIFVSFVLNDWLPKSQIAFSSWQKAAIHNPYPNNRTLLLWKWLHKYWLEFFVTKLVYQEWRRDFYGQQTLFKSLTKALSHRLKTKVEINRILRLQPHVSVNQLSQLYLRLRKKEDSSS